MTPKTVFKLLIDLTMTVLYALLMFGYGLDAFFHEFAGILTGALFELHFVINGTMLRGLWKRVNSGEASAAQTGLFLLDLILPVSTVVSVLTGVLMARTLYTLPVDLDQALLFTVHNVSSWVSLVVLGMHLLLHAGYLYRLFQAKRRRTDTLWKTAGRFAAGLMAAAFVYVIGYTAYSRSLVTEPLTYSQTEASSPASTESSSEASVSSTQSAPSRKEEESESSSSESEVVAAPTLSDYLGRLFCTGCHNHCPLTNPRCGRGEQQAEYAEQDYYDEYGSSESK